MKLPRHHRKSILALVQFVFVVQLLFGLFILPAMMTSGDSVVFREIHDEDLRDSVVFYHESNTRKASRVLIWSASIGLLLSTVATTTIED